MSSQQGTIFIVDISGYTHFVSVVDIEMGASIVSSLLSSIIGSNLLGFDVSEIEGDAVLFYKYGPPDAVPLILSQFESMLSAFNQTAKLFAEFFPGIAELSIKLIVHYGRIGSFELNGFCKLYGQAIIEAHRLLKNKIGSHTYALITQDYIKHQLEQISKVLPGGSPVCQRYDVGKICYTYFSYPVNIVCCEGSYC